MQTFQESLSFLEISINANLMEFLELSLFKKA